MKRLAVALLLTLCATGCRVWPWQKPFTYNCRLYVPADDPRGQIFVQYKRWALYAVNRPLDDHLVWYGDPNRDGHEDIIGFSRNEQASIWNRWPCP